MTTKRSALTLPTPLGKFHALAPSVPDYVNMGMFTEMMKATIDMRTRKMAKGEDNDPPYAMFVNRENDKKTSSLLELPREAISTRERDHRYLSMLSHEVHILQPRFMAIVVPAWMEKCMVETDKDTQKVTVNESCGETRVEVITLFIITLEATRFYYAPVTRKRKVTLGAWENLSGPEVYQWGALCNAVEEALRQPKRN